MNLPLQRLNPPKRPMHYHGNTSNLLICLQPLNLPKKKINLVQPASPGVPTRPLHGGTRSTNRKRRGKILNIKPHLLPVDDLVTQLIEDILGFFPLVKLQPGSPNYIYLRVIGTGFQMEEILKQVEVGLNPQESLTKVNKG